jgi:hypothetical protein
MLASISFCARSPPWSVSCLPATRNTWSTSLIFPSKTLFLLLKGANLSHPQAASIDIDYVSFSEIYIFYFYIFPSSSRSCIADLVTNIQLGVQKFRSMSDKSILKSQVSDHVCKWILEKGKSRDRRPVIASGRYGPELSNSFISDFSISTLTRGLFTFNARPRTPHAQHVHLQTDV